MQSAWCWVSLASYVIWMTGTSDIPRENPAKQNFARQRFVETLHATLADSESGPWLRVGTWLGAWGRDWSLRACCRCVSSESQGRKSWWWSSESSYDSHWQPSWFSLAAETEPPAATAARLRLRLIWASESSSSTVIWTSRVWLTVAVQVVGGHCQVQCPSRGRGYLQWWPCTV